MTTVLLDFRRPAGTRLTCKWIETGNPKQPLVCVWVDRVTGPTTAVREVEQTQAADASGFHLLSGHLCA
jgi:hypothetical protein